ncbi:MAG: tetraacyldisaccharide 4'-kinase, partial [Planctomycetaceae bacterium]
MNSRKFRDLISGHNRGLAARSVRWGLECLASIYGSGVRLRNRTYDRGLRKVQALPVPAISVGNLTAGGTGKTPFVAYLANSFCTHQHQPAILSRGYGSQDGEANDEKRVLDLLCPNVPHDQHPDRVAAAARVCEQHNIDVLILDDGFQHRRAARDLDIVLIDALNPWGFGHLLPRGLLREPPSALQ